MRHRKGGVNVAVPIAKTNGNGTKTALLQWTELIRAKQPCWLSARFILNYDKNAPYYSAFHRRDKLKIVILIEPGQPLPPGAFLLPEGYPAITRHEILYCYRSTAPIPGRLFLATVVDPAQARRLFDRFRADNCPTLYEMPLVTAVISHRNHSCDIGISLGLSLLMPSQAGKGKITAQNCLYFSIIRTMQSFSIISSRQILHTATNMALNRTTAKHNLRVGSRCRQYGFVAATTYKWKLYSIHVLYTYDSIILHVSSLLLGTDEVF